MEHVRSLTPKMLQLHKDTSMVCIWDSSPKEKNIDFQITLLRVIPTMTIIHFVAGKSSGILSGISSGILPGMSSGILWHIIWQIFWHSI